MKDFYKWLFDHVVYDALNEGVKKVLGLSFVAILWTAVAFFWHLSPRVLAWIQLGLLALTGTLGLVAYFRLSRAAQKTPIENPPAPGNTAFAPVNFFPQRDDKPDTTYRLKIWAAYRNTWPRPIVINQLQWHASSAEVPIQPPFAYRFQVEKTSGSWERDEWDKESLVVLVPAGGTFRFWIGVNSMIREEDIRARHIREQVGTATLSVAPVDQDFRAIQFRV